MSDGLLARYDSDEALRAEFLAMYKQNRSRFISELLKLAYSLGASRQEAVQFANAITRRIRTTTDTPGGEA